MSVKSITVTGEQLILQLSEPFDGELFVREQVAVVGPLAGRELSMVKVACNDGKLALPRFVGAHDRIYSQFTVWLPSHEKMDGVKYVTDFAEDVADWSYAYPQPSTKKTLGATPEDIRLLGIKQTHTNINLPQIMTPFEAEGTIPYVCDGKTYYFIGEEIEALDRWMQERWEAGALVTGILLNAPARFGSKQDPLLMADAIHPNFAWEAQNSEDGPTAFISAFNEFVAGLPLRHILIRSHLEQIIIMTYRNFATNQTSRYMQRDTNRTENLVYSTINYIDNNILNIKNLQEVGEALGYSYSYLSQLFSKSVGKPLKDYFFSKRFELAAELLEKYNVTTVAQQLGYDTVYSFSRAFKRHFGVAPSGYKKKKDPKQEGNP